MRLATLQTKDGPRAVVITEAGAALIADVGGQPISDVGALLRTGVGIDLARAAASGVVTGYSEGELLRPVLSPGAIVCVGLNYGPHILEMGRELPEDPTFFSKLPRSLTDPYAEITVPSAGSKAVDYEGEVAAVIGAGGRDIDQDDAWDHVAGLTVLNDLTMRDYQRRTLQWFAGKTWQDSTPFGPWITTVDELGDIGSLVLTTRVNGEVRQESALEHLVFDAPTLVADLSKIIELEPGDVIATGTPGGVGQASGTYLQDGDEVEVEITEIGVIRNRLRLL